MTGKISEARRSTAGGIPYKLVQGYPKISGDENGTTATEKYLIASSNVAAFYLESLPPPILFLNFFVLPARRRMPGTGFLITKRVDFEPHSGQLPGDPFLVDPDKPASYDDLYAVTIQYETMQESDDDERDETDPRTFLEHSINAGGEFLSIPSNKTTVDPKDVENNAPTSDEDGNPLPAAEEPNEDRNMPILWQVPTLEHNLRWDFVLSPPWERIFKMMGTVNSQAVDLFFDAPAETVMFMGVSGSQTYLWDGASARVQPWKLDFKFSQRHIEENGFKYGWNHVYSPKKGQWVKVRRANGLPLYQSENHLDLFKAG